MVSVHSDDDSGSPPTSKKRRLPGDEAPKCKYKQKFRSEWLYSKDFLSWLCEHPTDPCKALCSICNTTMNADIGVLKKHKETSKHKGNKENCQQSSTSNLSETTKTQSVNNKIKQAQLKLAVFMAEHEISPTVMDHLNDLLSDIFPDSNIATNLRMKHSQLQAVTTKVLGTSEKDSLIYDLRCQKFSVLVDENIDIGVIKTICVVVHYYDPKAGRLVSRFWDLIPFEKSKDDHTTNAHFFYNAIIQSFKKNTIPLGNIVGIGLDGCNTMMGIPNSVSSKFRQSFPGIVIFKCICHSLRLCASDAAKEIPSVCEQLARDIYHHFKSSSKLQSQYIKVFKIFVEVDLHEILYPAQTRLLSLFLVVDQLLDHWDALRMYFKKCIDDHECREILKKLNDPIVKAYFYFLSWMLPKFENINAFFQSKSTVITEVHTKMRHLYRDLITIVMQPEYTSERKLDTIDPTNKNLYLHLDDICLGVGVRRQLSLLQVQNNKNDIQEFKSNCRNYIIRALKGIRQRYSLDDELLYTISTLKPEACLSLQRPSSLAPLFELFPRIAPKLLQEQQILDDQWRHLPFYKQDKLDFNNPEIFWHQVAELQDNDGNKLFTKLSHFMLQILSLPLSNADCERIFNKVNNIKVDKSNQLTTKIVAGNLLAEQCIKRHGKTCVDFKPTEKMICMMNA